MRQAARDASLAPALVAAFVAQESGGDPDAWNPEPAYRYLWDVRNDRPFRALTREEAVSGIPPKDFRSLIGDPDQEWWAQRASWGLMQVMGGVARELGLKAPYLTALLRPDVGLTLGCQLLAKLSRGRTVEDAISAYNAGVGGIGSNPRYVAGVLAHRAAFERDGWS